MKVTITSIELKSPFKFFPLSIYAMNILEQIKAGSCFKMKKGGFWTKHYTMTLWPNEDELKKFSTSGAHLEAMKASKSLAKEIRTLTIEADALPQWQEAKELLKKNGRSLKFN